MRSFKLPSSYLRHPAKYQTPSVLHFTNKNQFGKSVFCKHLYPRFSCPQRQTICFSRDKNDHVQTVRRCRRTCRITVDTPSVTPQPEEHSPTESLSVLNGRSCRFVRLFSSEGIRCYHGNWRCRINQFTYQSVKLFFLNQWSIQRK